MAFSKVFQSLIFKADTIDYSSPEELQKAKEEEFRYK